MDDLKKRSGWFIHVAIWMVIFAMPFFSPQPGRPLHGGVDYSHFLPPMISFFVVFYVNYFLLIKKFLFNRRFGMFLLWNVLLIALASVLVHLTFELSFHLTANLPPRRRPMLDTISFMARNTVIYIAIVGISIAVRMTTEWYRSETERKEIEKGKAEAELANLKSQINPHFLFNTLNNIYSLIQIDQDKAQNAVHDLSGMLRYVLYDSENSTVPLSKEITFIEDYIKLMSMRLSSNVKLEVSLPKDVTDKKVAPLLFIPLVENAFKHGISDTQDSFIRICLQVDGDYVICKIENSCYPKTDSDRSGSGIGLKNLQRRLDMLYPGKYSFEYGKVHTSYQSVLRINTSGIII